jgi:hypothetical protein
MKHAIVSPQEKHSFPFVTTVTWIYVDSATKMVRKKPPKLLFSLPPDIFYPFSIGSGTNNRDSRSATNEINMATSVTSNYSGGICKMFLHILMLLSFMFHLFIYFAN